MENRPIRILHVLARMDFGGTETMLMNLYRAVDTSKIQFDFAVCTDSEAPYDAEILERGGRIFHYPRYAIKNHFSYCTWWKNFFRNEGKNYIIVHGHIGSTAAIYLSVAKKFGKYAIAHSHGTNEPLNNLKSCLYRLYSYPTRFIADGFLACSQQAMQDRFGSRLTQRNKPNVVLYNGIHTSKYVFSQNIRESIRLQLDIDADALVVGHVGRYTKAKNPLFILDVFKELHNVRSDSRLLYIGKGEMEDKIKQRIRQLNIGDYVVTIPETTCVNNYLQAMDVFLFPSVFEGLGIVTIEAQAAGLPVLASDAVPEETKVTDLICYKSLQHSPASWAAELVNMYEGARTRNRRDANSIVGRSPFNIEAGLEQLLQFYNQFLVR